ncbi:MAG: hypothetical protein LBV43_02895 [Prevotella sp.]|jgi:hypothetical protein|nr:hypothetical protein [Prevotella sp.]
MNKTKYIVRLLSLGLFFIIPIIIKAQCPFTATITTMDAGGCGNSNGSVYFSVLPNTPSSIVGIYYLVYQSDGTTLVTSPTNTNPEVSLAAGSYVAEVQVQCTSGTQSPWRQNFTINNISGSTTFTGTYNASNSRLTSLNLIPSGVLAYNFSGTGPYTVDIIDYPVTYTGSRHFTGISNGIFKLENLPAGNYRVRMTNGCMSTIEGPRTIINSGADIGLRNNMAYISDNFSALNTNPGYNENRPTTDYNWVYFSAYSGVDPVDYWGATISSQYYEYALIYESEGEVVNGSTVWYDLLAGSAGSNKITTRYTIGQMFADANKIPTIYVRLKGTTLMAKKKPTMSIYNGSVGLYTVKPSKENCGNADITVVYSARTALTYPLNVEIRNYAGSSVIKSYTITDAEMQSAAYTASATVTNVDISSGYSIWFNCTGDPATHKMYSSQGSFGSEITVRATRSRLFDFCGSDIVYFELGPNSTLDTDLRGATITYTGTIPLPADIIQSYTIPEDYPTLVSRLYLSTKIGNNPHSNSDGFDAATGTYEWTITTPCVGGTSSFKKTVSVSAPTTVTFDESKFNPKVVASTNCGYVEIEVGDINDLKRIIYSNGNPVNATFVLTKKQTGWNGGTEYRYLGSSDNVYYDGGQNGYLSTYYSANFLDGKPKIRVYNPGTYYLLVAGASTTGWGTTFTESLDHCYIMREFVLTQGDFEGKLDLTKTAGYYCAQDKSTGVLFVHREGTQTGSMYKFKVWNSSGTYNKTIESDEIQCAFLDINTSQHGSTFNVSVETSINCSVTPSTAVVTLNEVNNSATIITQNISSDCSGTLYLDITGTAYTHTAYQWRDAYENILSSTNTLSGYFATGTKLYLDVTFSSQGPGGVVAACDTWTKEYLVQGQSFEEFHWRYDAADSNWNNPSNWNDKDGKPLNAIPGACSSAYIPAVVAQYYPDLAAASPVASVSNIYFAFGGQLYSQHKLGYEKAFVSYNFGYYNQLADPAPSVLTQPDRSIDQATASTYQKSPIALNNLPTMERARAYMLATPLKGMLSADFQMAGKPYTMQQIHAVKRAPDLYVSGKQTVTPKNDYLLSDNYNAISLWVPPHANFLGASDQSIAQALNGVFVFPYFYPQYYYRNNDIIAKHTDKTYDGIDQMSFMQIEMLTLALSDPINITRTKKEHRFVYENSTTNAIPADNVYSVSVLADNDRENGEIMVGNPFMAPLDFDAFLTANSGVITSTYKIIVNGVEKSYNQANSSGNTLNKYIAAQQAFIVVLANPKAAATLKFPIASIATQNNTTISVKPQ